MAMGTLQIREAGEIREIKKDIARIEGLSSCMNGELLMGFTESSALALLLGSPEDAKIGGKVYSNREPFTITVGRGFQGRIVNALAEPVDGKGPVVAEGVNAHTGRYPVFRDAPSVLERIPITGVFETGILIIGKGQRQLIIGDRMTGKTTICVDAILNQREKNVVCVYCCVGRAQSSLQNIVETFKLKGALDYTVVVSASASASVGEQYLAPYTACALGEYFMDNGKDVFVVFDDLTKHAWAYRQLSLLLERSPGRDAYPGDIFYLHSQLMERAAKLSPEYNGGSMTFFPIVDTLQGDITGYIPSNLVSMTDGQIYLNTALFSGGFKPAVDLGLSVSRVGNKVQCPAMKGLSGMLRLEYLQYNELLRMTRFKASISEETTRRLKHGEVITALFIQDRNEPYSMEEQIIFLYALNRNVLDALPDEAVKSFKKEILNFARKGFPSVIKDLSVELKITEKISKALDECLVKYFRSKDLELI
jgi:F-type H+-transporting ATPase subunit alpha